MNTINNLYTLDFEDNILKNKNFFVKIDVEKILKNETKISRLPSFLPSVQYNTAINYKITDQKNSLISDKDLESVNSIFSEELLFKRFKKLTSLGYKINFDSYDDKNLALDLQLLDSDLPEIIAHIVKDKYVSKITKITSVIKKLEESNPMNYDQSLGHNFYEYKIINFLIEAALGMTSKEVWTGVYDVVGGIIIVKPDSEILCYHLIDFNKFKHYLKTSARLDNPSGSKMEYGSVYREGNDSFIKLNFQIKA